MTLSAWDMADLDRLAADCVWCGKQPAARVYHKFAAARGWFGMLVWIEGRDFFRASHRAKRQAAQVAA